MSVVAISTRVGRPLIERCSGSSSRERSPKSVKDLAHCASGVFSRVTRYRLLLSSRENDPLPPLAGPTHALVVGVRARRAAGGRRG